ncbi:MAG TPA: GAF domain-containing protein [Solirubrobacteraceae bacterium]|nr:GAF domain-containing protein [Solirubrobacteraceae bacterium]
MIDRDHEQAIRHVLELAQGELNMDVALLGEVVDGREVVRFTAGDAASFGVRTGASTPVEETYCHRILEGRLPNAVADARTDVTVRDLRVTKLAGVGSYIGVPLTARDARLYILCCLAHEARPELGEADVRFLRGLAETVIDQLDHADDPA